MAPFVASVCARTPIAIPDLRDDDPYVSSYCLLPDRMAQEDMRRIRELGRLMVNGARWS